MLVIHSLNTPHTSNERSSHTLSSEHQMVVDVLHYYLPALNMSHGDVCSGHQHACEVHTAKIDRLVSDSSEVRTDQHRPKSTQQVEPGM